MLVLNLVLILALLGWGEPLRARSALQPKRLSDGERAQLVASCGLLLPSKGVQQMATDYAESKKSVADTVMENPNRDMRAAVNAIDGAKMTGAAQASSFGRTAFTLRVVANLFKSAFVGSCEEAVALYAQGMSHQQRVSKMKAKYKKSREEIEREPDGVWRNTKWYLNNFVEECSVQASEVLEFLQAKKGYLHGGRERVHSAQNGIRATAKKVDQEIAKKVHEAVQYDMATARQVEP